MQGAARWIDLTGNWHMGQDFQKGIIVSEPVPPMEGNVFTQRLTLAAGEYELKLVYNSDWDHSPMKALFNCPERFPIRVNGREYILHFVPDSNEIVYQARLPFAVDTAQEVVISARVFDTRMMNTYLRGTDDVKSSDFAALKGRGNDLFVVRGVPFLSREVSEHLDVWYFPASVTEKPIPPSSGNGLVNWGWEGARFTGDVKVKRAYFLGLTHVIDHANGSWYSRKGDHAFSHFVGDPMGALRLRFADGTVEDVPLVCGFNVWYGNPWDVLWEQERPHSFHPNEMDARERDATLFGGNAKYRQTIRDCVGVDDAVRRVGAVHNQRYLFALDLDGRVLRSVELLPGDEVYGFVTISGITLQLEDETDTLPGCLQLLPQIAPVSDQISAYTLDYIHNRAYEPSLERIRRVLYTHTDELPVLSEPEKPKGYVGPEYDFKGCQDALLTATYLYWNGPECAAYIADGGMTCSSQTARWRTTPYRSGMGVWMRTYPPYDGIEGFLKEYVQREAGQFPPKNAAWSRGIGELLREAMALGYDKCVDNYTDWLDEALFREANPPHWNRIVGVHSEGFHNCMVGDVQEQGNRENDGHGICMWGRYMMWLWKARDREWNRRHYPATRAAADWLQWQLDTDTIRPGRRMDILFTESECAHSDYDFYSSYNCLHGLKLSMRMAAQLGEMEDYSRWAALYDRLAKGIYNLLRDDSPFGLIWHTEDKCDWQEHAHKLAHIQLSTDGDTYTPLEDYTSGYDKLYLETDINTYRFLMKDKNYDSLRNYGYGQGMMTQAALLLDQMEDTERFVNMMVTHNYLPRLEKWASPEGIITHRSGKFYVPVNGYMGQDSHVADSVKALRLMLGVDDNATGRLRLVPRFPASWTECAIEKYPVLIGDHRGTLKYSINRNQNDMTLCASLSAPADLDIRLGPFPTDARVTAAFVNGACVGFDSYVSGDSRWVWLRGIRGSEVSASVHLAK